jgi:lysophospholipase L1-like esterase
MRKILIEKATSRWTAVLAIPLLAILVSTMRPPLPGKKCTYLALGDSYTIGEKVSAEENFPNQVVSLLREKNIPFESPQIIARTGWTTDELADAITKAPLDRQYDIVSLLVGVNNQYRGRTVRDYAIQFESLLKQAILFSGNRPKRVIVISIPDWSVTPFAEGSDRKKISSEIDEFNKVNKEIAEKYSVHYVDITGGTRLAKNDLSLLTTDELHPSGREYNKWAKALAGIVSKEIIE